MIHVRVYIWKYVKRVVYLARGVAGNGECRHSDKQFLYDCLLARGKVTERGEFKKNAGNKNAKYDAYDDFAINDNYDKQFLMQNK